MFLSAARIGAILLILALGGCGWTFGLPGHNADNFDHPPDLVLHVKGFA
jgi:hypothetical protein